MEVRILGAIISEDETRCIRCFQLVFPGVSKGTPRNSKGTPKNSDGTPRELRDVMELRDI
jgi:hypothetical protein